MARVWDMRTKAQIHMLDGHTGTVGSIIITIAIITVATSTTTTTTIPCVEAGFASFATSSRAARADPARPGPVRLVERVGLSRLREAHGLPVHHFVHETLAFVFIEQSLLLVIKIERPVQLFHIVIFVSVVIFTSANTFQNQVSTVARAVSSDRGIAAAWASHSR